jgi:NitT/TauT family transport system substrate-binding protein
MRRLTFTVSVLVSALFLTNPAPAFSQKLRPVTVGMTGRTIASLPFEMSIGRGHFKQAGLDVKLITINQSDVIIKATMTNELTFMSIIPTAILASVRGLPVRTIAVNLENAPYVLVGRPQIKSMSDMKGKKVAVSSLGSMSTYVVREIVARNGLDPERDLTVLAVGGSGARAASLAAGFVDAALVTAPMNYDLERQGFTRLAWGPDFVRYPLNGVAGSTDFLAANRELVLAFLRGVAGGVRDVKQRKSEMIPFVKEYLKLPEEEAVKSYEFLVANMSDNLETDDATILRAMQFAGNALKLKPEAMPDIAKVRDWSFARALK